jgi:hypothetical protein
LPVLLLLGGCNIVAYAATAIPQTVSAKHTPPKTPMLVLVENRQNPSTMVTEADQLTGFIMEELEAYHVAPLIELKKLYEVRDDEKNIDKMTISQIGKAVGAQQVLYVDLRRVNVSEDDGGGIPMHSRLDAAVHLVDVKTSTTTFPTAGQANWPISLETPITTIVNRTNPEAVRESLLRSAGTSIGRLFHDYPVQ